MCTIANLVEMASKQISERSTTKKTNTMCGRGRSKAEETSFY